MSIEKVLYRAHAHVAGSRDGRATIPESNLDLKPRNNIDVKLTLV